VAQSYLDLRATTAVLLIRVFGRSGFQLLLWSKQIINRYCSNQSLLFASLSCSLFSKIGHSTRSSIVGAIHGDEHAVCVICDGSGHKSKQRGRKIVTHSLDYQQFGTINVGRRVLSGFRGN
jgi:hypothetical protein